MRPAVEELRAADIPTTRACQLTGVPRANLYRRAARAAGSTSIAAGALTGAGEPVSHEPARPLMLAKAAIDELDEGYFAETVLLTPTLYARLSSKVAGILPRENVDGVVASGRIPEFAGLRFLMGTRLPVNSQPLVCDSTQLGGLAYEDIPSPRLGG